METIKIEVTFFEDNGDQVVTATTGYVVNTPEELAALLDSATHN